MILAIVIFEDYFMFFVVLCIYYCVHSNALWMKDFLKYKRKKFKSQLVKTLIAHILNLNDLTCFSIFCIFLNHSQWFCFLFLFQQMGK